MNEVKNTIEFKPIALNNFTSILNVLYSISFFCFYYSHISTWTEINAQKTLNSPIYPIFLCFSVFFLLLSGANFRINTVASLTQARNNNIVPFLTLILFGCSIKSMLLFGSQQFFRWEAPHTILVSILILYLMSKAHVFFNYLIFIIVILGRHEIFKMMNSVLLQLTDHKFMISPQADTIIIKALIILIFLLVSIQLSKKLRFRPRFKLIYYFIFSAVSILWLSSNILYKSSEVTVFKSLPYGIFIGDSRHSQHAFGLIFWLPIVFLGYLLVDLILIIKNSTLYNFIIFTSSFLVLSYLIYISAMLETNSKFSSLADLGNEFMMDPVNSNTLLFASIFITSVYILNMLTSWIQKITLFRVLSNSIFYQYIFVTLFGAKICSMITALEPRNSFLISMVFLLSVGIGLAYLIDYLSSFKLEFAIRPSKKIGPK